MNHIKLLEKIVGKKPEKICETMYRFRHKGRDLICDHRGNIKVEGGGIYHSVGEFAGSIDNFL